MISMCSSTWGTTLRTAMRTSRAKPVRGWRCNNTREMRCRLVGRALPGKRLGERARRSTELLHELARGRDTIHRRRHRRGVSMRYEIACFTVSNGLANARRVGCNNRGRARGRLEIRNTPPFLRRGKNQRPRATQQGELLMLRDTPKKPHAVAEVKRMHERFEPRTVVAGAGDLERCLARLHLGEGPNHVMHSLVLLEASQVGKSG